MSCYSPYTVGFLADGKTLSFNPNKYSKEYPPFKIPCNKCIACRLDYATQWAIRCVHEASLNEKNIFLTLTYDEKNYVKKLNYSHFQKFIKRLRKSLPDDQKISYFVTGEYGEKFKRPHWHVIIFNYEPSDKEFKYTSQLGDPNYSSDSLKEIWGKGNIEFGAVTLKSASYCARYAAKKLVHGNDCSEFQPISKKSNKSPIGQKFLKLYYKDIFNYGELIVEGKKRPIPRYYERWLKKEHPDKWLDYIENVKLINMTKAEQKETIEKEKYLEQAEKRLESGKLISETTHNEMKRTIFKQKLKQLTENIKDF